MQESIYKKKLVRDLIPNIANKNAEYIFHKANDDEYILLLKSKLLEEVGEFLSSHSIEELADILEVIEALYIDMGYTEDQLMKIKKEKKVTRGGFTQRIVLTQNNKRV